MIIRTQNKKTIVNFDAVDTICVDSKVPIIKYYSGTEETVGALGTYSTEEKAIKVLDMICNANRNAAFIDKSAVLFEMPQDSEV